MLPARPRQAVASMKQRIRINIFMDQESESMRYVAQAERDGRELHRISRYGGDEAVEDVFQAMLEWLNARGCDLPDHYWMKQYLR